MTRPRPIVHARDHEHGGPDVVRIVWESVGSAGGGTGIFFDTDPQNGDFLVITATGEGTGFDAGQMALECNGGTTWLKNSDEGVVVYGTGDFTAGRITDLDAALLETGADRPSVIIAGSNGIVLSTAAIDAGDEHGSLNLVFVFCDTGNNLLRSPAILAQTTDPHIAGALWNSSGTVKVSSG